MSIRARNIHFSNWAKVIAALADKGVTVANEEEARTFLIDTSSDANPYYYYVGYIKDTQEIYTHGKFYSCSDSSYDDTELRDLIGTKADLSALEALVSEVEENEEVTAAGLTELHENKADKSEIPDVSAFATKDELNTLSAEVDNKIDSTTFTTLSETVAGHTTSIDNLSNNKADKTELEYYATTADLNTKQDLLVSGTNIKTVNSNSILGSGNIETPDTKVTSAANHYGYNSNNATSTTGAFVTKITKDAANHVTSFESRALTATDIPSLDASKITSGTISIERLPAGALERIFVVASETAAMSATVQEGDVVQVTGNNNKMYFCISNTATTFATKFKEFTAGTATSVPWSGVTGKPDLATQEELDVVDAKFDNYQLKITSSNKLAYSLINGAPDLSVYALKTSIPTKLSQLNDDVVAGKYLSLSGGTINGSITATSFVGDLAGNADSAYKLVTNEGADMVHFDANILYVGNTIHANSQTHLLGKSIRLRYGVSADVGLTLTETGNVAIGGTTADAKLHVHGDVKASGSMYAVDFETTSDNRLKDFVSDIHVDFESLKQIPKKYYYWKDKSMGEDLQLGTSAQELAKIYPECVHYDETNDRYSVNYQKLSIVALAAIDKLHDRISELESKLYD